MKTDALIALLAAGGSPGVPPHAARRRLAWALACGLPVALLAMALALGVRRDLAQAALGPMFWFKLGMPLLLAAAGAALAERLGRPGAAVPGWLWALAALPVAAFWAAGGVALAEAPATARPALLWGGTWRTCPINIVLIALPVLAGGLWALRGLAPTRPALAGAGAGALAAGAGAAVYALHCAEMAAPFLAAWYVLGMALTVALGAALGARLLRW